MRKQGLFGVHTEQTRDDLLAHGKKGTTREYQTKYNCAFFLAALLEYLKTLR